CPSLSSSRSWVLSFVWRLDFFQRHHSASAVDARTGDIRRRLPRSPFWIRGPNVILRRYLGMAREPAFGTARAKFGTLKRVSRWIIIPARICTSVRVGESLGIFFDECNRLQGLRHVYEIGRFSILFEGPLDLGNLGAVREKPAVAGNPVPISVDHRFIRRDHFQ